MESILKRINKLTDNEKVFLTHKIFDYWLKGRIKNKDKLFLPEQLNIYNSKDVSKVFLICSKIKSNREVSNIFDEFKELDFDSKLNTMIYLFNKINDLDIVPTYITYNLNFKNLSNKINEYRLSL